MKKTKITNRKKINFFVKILIFTFLIFCAVTIISQLVQFNIYEKEYDSLKDDVYKAEQLNEELLENLNRPFDDQYIISIARKKLHYHLIEEIIFYNDLKK